MFAFIKYTNRIFSFKKKIRKMGTIIDILQSRFNAMNRYGIVLMDAGDSGGVLFPDIKYDYYAPNFEKVDGAYCFWSVGACVRACVGHTFCTYCNF